MFLTSHPPSLQDFVKQHLFSSVYRTPKCVHHGGKKKRNAGPRNHAISSPPSLPLLPSAAPASTPGLRLRLLLLLRPPPPRPPPPLLLLPLPGGGRTKAKSTWIVWSSSFWPSAPSIAARASCSVAYSIRAYPYTCHKNGQFFPISWWAPPSRQRRKLCDEAPPPLPLQRRSTKVSVLSP